MEKLQTFGLAMCLVMLAGLAVYTVEISLPGQQGVVQQAEAIRRSTHQCTGPVILGC